MILHQFQVPDNPMPPPPRDPREQAVIFQHPNAPAILLVPTAESIAYAKAQAEAEIAKAHQSMAAMERCRAAGVPRQLLDLFFVDGPYKVMDWVQVCVLEQIGGKR